MLQLLSEFTVSQIISYTVFLALAIKGVIDFIDWIKQKMQVRDQIHQNRLTEHERLDKIEDNVNSITNSVNSLTQKVDLLLDSDKDDIKAYITKEHHYFCYQKGWIDDYSLDCLERRYEHYQDEHGNSFVEQLMNEIRKLPKQQENEESH